MCTPLPIDRELPGILASLARHPNLVVLAPPGSGKTTRVPAALIDASALGVQRCLVLEPRRVAARAAARRVCDERRSPLGEGVGYQVRFDNRTSATTRLCFLTEGILTARLQADPFLEGIDAVVLDEFHERSLEADLALALLREVQTEVRPTLKIVVLSATLDPAPVAAYLDAPVIRSGGRCHPVTIHYLQRDDDRPLAQRTAAGIQQIWQQRPESDGGLLAFLPGAADIRRTAETLAPWARSHGIPVLPMHGDLPATTQDAVLRPAEEERIILSTNVAESSVTVAGVTAVVDSGLAKVLRHDPGRGIDRLEVEPISRASADQRAGRAGRTGPGVALRLWSEHAHRSRREHGAPEIQRVDLAPALLQILGWGHADPTAFAWFTPPPPERIETALVLLRGLAAVDRKGRLTADGETLRRLPLHPRIGRLLLNACRAGYPKEGARMAALLTERDILLSGRALGNTDELPGAATSDVLQRLDLLEQFHAHGGTPAAATQLGLDRPAVRGVYRAAEQLLRLSQKFCAPVPSRDAPNREGHLLRAIYAAYPDRVAQRRSTNRYRMVGGRNVVLSPRCTVHDAPLITVLRCSAGPRREFSTDTVHWASRVEREWLQEAGEGLQRAEATLLTDGGRVVCRHTTLYRDLPIQERESAADPQVAATILARHAAADPEKMLQPNRATREFVARCRFLAEHLPQLGLPTWGSEDWQRALEMALAGAGATHTSQLRTIDHLPALQQTLTWAQRNALEREAPERIEVPSGSHLRITYLQHEAAQRPVLAVKIQEIFGWRSAPRLAQGKIPLLLHLLGPHGRPLQVTEDLESFWARGYPEVRKEMRGRYPKHRWPEDPWSATPSRHSVAKRAKGSR